MKKFYEMPNAELSLLKCSSFLEASNDQISVDPFNDDWANALGANPSV